MNQERLMKVLLAPHVSEKSTMATELSNQVVFKVVPDATKAEVKQAVELLFDVKVNAVQVLNVKGKTKRTGKVEGRRKNWRKAYVSLAEGNEIDFLGAE
jgi:large subunit ribosomal protein L23